MSRAIEAGIIPTTGILKEDSNIPKVTRDARGTRVLWRLEGNMPEQNEQLGIRNVQGLFFEQFPEFNDLFPRGEDGMIPEDKREEAKEFILEKIGALKEFKVHIGVYSIIKNKFPHFEGSHLIAIRKSFIVWGLNFKDFNYLQEDKWTTKNQVRDEFGIGQKALKTLLSGIPSRIGIARRGGTTIFYDRISLDQKVLAPPINDVNREGKTPSVNRDSRGRTIWNLPRNTSEQNEQLGIRNVQGLFLERFPEFDELFPKDEYGLIVESKRERAKRFILEKMQSQKNFNSVIGPSPSHNRVTPYFNGSHIIALHKSFAPWGININQEDSNRMKQSRDMVWQKANEFFQNEGDITSTLLKKRGNYSLLAAIRRFYPGKMFQLREDLSLDPIRRPPTHWSHEKIEQEALLFAESNGGLTYSLLMKHHAFALQSAIVEKYPGGLRDLQSKLGLTTKRRQKGYYTLDRIEEEARDFYLREGILDYTILRSHNKSGLGSAISKYYPGSITALREKLGITTSHPEDTISPDQANEELMRFLEVRDE